YLSRALHDLGFHVLALDNNENQTSGANRWKNKEKARKVKQAKRKSFQKANEPTGHAPATNTPIYPGDPTHLGRDIEPSDGLREGSLTHHTMHISPRSLESSVSDWLLADLPEIRNSDVGDPPGQIPVMFVALHACGSLTVDVLRTFLSYYRQGEANEDAPSVWTPHSLVVVGCCYNLMSPSGMPELTPTPTLPIAALHLAAQVPSQWLKSPQATQDAELSIRKVVYRALLQPVLQAALQSSTDATGNTPLSEQDRLAIPPGLGETPENRRLGKINDKAYEDWPTFLERATNKMGIDITDIGDRLPSWFSDEEKRLQMESRLWVLQTIRCILGPLIESLIVLDRYEWLRDELAGMEDGAQKMAIEIVNLFDQATGSGRNIALVIQPLDDLGARTAESGGEAEI
ncbi:hypothetical protein HYDPIDRAFT_99006, partial [Hydnomerulius pinastri MD-312]